MSDYRKIYLTVNPALASIVDPATPDTPAPVGVATPAVYYGETVVFCICFVDSTGQGVSLQNQDTFEVSADCNFLHGEDPLMAFSGPSMINLAGDWNQALPSAGKISARVNFCTESFAEKLSGTETLSAWLEIRKFNSAGNPSVMLQTRLAANNVIHAGEGTPTSSNPDYYTAAQTDALIAGVAGAEPQIRYSVDGSTVADSATGALFWSFRLGDDGVWSAWLPIPQPDTPAGRVEYAFSVAADNTATSLPILYSALGIPEAFDLSLFEVQSSGAELNITHTSSLQMLFYSDRLELVWNGAFPAGSYVIRG